MVAVFYFISALFLSILPFFNGIYYLSALFFLLALLSSVRMLLLQWCVLLAWVFASNYLAQSGQSDVQFPDEFYLYMLHALVFTITAPLSSSHIKQLSNSRFHPLLILIRHTLVVSSILFLTTSFFRPFLPSNSIWAMVCYINAHYLPQRKTAVTPRKLLKRITLYSFLIILVLLLIEIEVRLFLVAPPPPAGYYMPHPRAIFTARPSSYGPTYLKDNNGAIITPLVTISSQGLRDQEFAPKQPDEYRIILLGDSFTMGHGLEANKTIDAVLEPLLNAANTDKKVQVINCGVGGYAPWQEQIFLQEKGFPLEPDMVILQLFPANDVAGSYNKVNKYLHAIDPKWEYDLINYHRLNQYLPLRIERKCKQFSSAYRLLLSIIGSNGLVSPVFANCRLLPPVDLPRVASQSDRSFIFEVCLEDWYPELHEAWEIYANDIRGIRDDCRARGVPLAAYAHGASASLRPEVWQGLNEQYPETPYEMNKDIRLTNELLDELEIPRIDVFSTLSKYPYTSIHFVCDDHFSPTGAKVVAKCLCDYILNNNLIK